MRFTVSGVRFRGKALGFKGSGFKGSGFKGSGFRVWGPGLKRQELRFKHPAVRGLG